MHRNFVLENFNFSQKIEHKSGSIWRIASNFTAIIFFQYRAAVEMALEMLGYTMCRVRLWWLVSLKIGICLAGEVELFFWLIHGKGPILLKNDMLANSLYIDENHSPLFSFQTVIRVVFFRHQSENFLYMNIRDELKMDFYAAYESCLESLLWVCYKNTFKLNVKFSVYHSQNDQKNTATKIRVNDLSQNQKPFSIKSQQAIPPIRMKQIHLRGRCIFVLFYEIKKRLISSNKS